MMRSPAWAVGTTVAGRASRAWAGLRACGPFVPLAVPALALLALLSGSRLALFLTHWDRLDGFGGAGRLFWIGLRIDGSLVAYLSALPAVLFLVAGKRVVRAIRWLPIGYWTLVFGVATFLELATSQFIGEFGLRPNRLFFEYLDHPREVLATVWSEQWLALLFVIPATAAVLWSAIIVVDRLIAGYDPWTWRRRAVAVVPTLMALFLVARGTLDHRPVNISTAAFSGNQFANQLALNSTYSLLYAVYSLRHESDPSRSYGTMPPDEMLSLVLGSEHIGRGDAAPDDAPLLHYQPSHHHRARPLNLVIILEESLGAEFVGCLGGLPLTPNLDRLSEEGMLLRHLYSTGVRTVRGIEAVVSGFPPTPGRSVVKLDLAQHGFFTLATLLREQGYETEFIYGGASHFDNMRSFFRNNGFAEIHDETTFPERGFHGTWGFSDEDLFREADRIFRGHPGKPFFGLILTTSNHSPFEFPENRIELYEEPPNSRHNAMKYADYALGRFFDLARESDYYPDTLFIVVADHNTRTYGNELVPIKKFRIPGLVLGPGVPRMPYDRVASQLDLAPTALDLLGLDVSHPMIGQSLVGPADRQPDRAIMQFGYNNAYMVGKRVVVLRPKLPPVEFTYEDERLVPAELDPSLAREALAHALLPGWLYSNRLYGNAHPVAANDTAAVQGTVMR